MALSRGAEETSGKPQGTLSAPVEQQMPLDLVEPHEGPRTVPSTMNQDQGTVAAEQVVSMHVSPSGNNDKTPGRSNGQSGVA
jgi:hypothetical protein